MKAADIMRYQVILLSCSVFTAFSVSAQSDISADGIRFSNQDGSGWIRVGGRLHYDIARFDDDLTALKDSEDFRRARIAVTLQANDFRIKADRDVGGVITGWKTLYLQYRGLDRTRVTFGNQVAPFSMEDLIGSNNGPLMERSIANGLSPGLLTGLSVSRWSEHWSLTGGVFGNELSDQDRRKSKGRGAVARFTYAPVRHKRNVFHVGLSYEYRDPNDRDELRLRSRPGTRLTDTRLVDTATIADVDSTQAIGLELAYMAGPVSVQTEYLNMAVQRNQGSDLEFDGGYLLASIVLSGEFRPYTRRNGTFGEIEPEHKWGALEMAARYSTLDLEDRDVSGGQEDNYTLGLNWYINKNFRAMLNYVNYQTSPNKNGLNESGSIWLMRLQAKI